MPLATPSRDALRGLGAAQLGHLRHLDDLSRRLPNDWSGMQGRGFADTYTEQWDPVGQDNIIYSAYVQSMAVLHDVLFDDDRYAEPGALSFDHWSFFWGTRRTADADDPDGYAMPHTAFAYVPDPDGRYLDHLRDAMAVSDMTARLRTLLDAS